MAEHVGQGASPILKTLLRFTSWLTRDPFGMAVKRLQGLKQDYGAAFDGEVVQVEPGYVKGGVLGLWGLCVLVF